MVVLTLLRKNQDMNTQLSAPEKHGRSITVALTVLIWILIIFHFVTEYLIDPDSVILLPLFNWALITYLTLRFIFNQINPILDRKYHFSRFSLTQRILAGLAIVYLVTSFVYMGIDISRNLSRLISPWNYSPSFRLISFWKTL